MAERRFPIRLAVAFVVAMAIGIPSLWGLAHKLFFHPVALYLDNGGDVELRVSVDGKAPVAVAAHSWEKFDTGSGHHTLVATHVDGKAVDEQALDATGDPYLGDAYVFNIGGMNHYAVYTAKYSTRIGVAEDDGIAPEKIADARVFAVPVGVGREFASAFPPSIRRDKYDHSPNQEKRLFHYPLHSGLPCCRAYDE